MLWQFVRAHRFGGLKFRRQHAIGPYIVDFYCASLRLVVEVDGPIHANQAHEDENRQRYLEHLGLEVLRFSNDEVLNDPASVLDRLKAAVQKNGPVSRSLWTSPSPVAGEGDRGGEVSRKRLRPVF